MSTYKAALVGPEGCVEQSGRNETPSFTDDTAVKVPNNRKRKRQVSVARFTTSSFVEDPLDSSSTD